MPFWQSQDSPTSGLIFVMAPSAPSGHKGTRPPQERRFNNIYGEMRKMAEQHLISESVEAKVLTSGPRGPLYAETTNDSFDIITVYLNSDDYYSWRIDQACLEPLKLSEEIVSKFVKEAVVMATKWD